MNEIRQMIPLPRDEDAERAVLGAVLIDSGALIEVVDILTPPMLFDGRNKAIYEAILRLYARSKPIDLISVKNEIGKEPNSGFPGGENPAMYLMEITSNVSSSANIAYHCRIIAEKHVLRSLWIMSQWVGQRALEGLKDPFTLLQNAEDLIYKIIQQNIKTDIVNVDSVASEFIERFEKAYSQPNELIGVPSGFACIDKVTNGFPKGEVTIIAGRPGMGKTALMLNIVYKSARYYKQKIAVFSLEMSAGKLFTRIVSDVANVDNWRIEKGQMERAEADRVIQVAGELSNLPIYIDDSSSLGVSELRTKCRKIMHEKGLDMVVIDYLQLMNPPANSNMKIFDRVTHVSNGIRALAKELNIPVVALAQLSRSNEHRGGDKRPNLSDLKGSGDIEQDASIVAFIHRPEYYKVLFDDNGNSTEGKAFIFIEKNRNGRCVDIEMNFIGEKFRFEDPNTAIDTAPILFKPSDKYADDIRLPYKDSDENAPF
jgi:replicative DNA helicase